MAKSKLTLSADPELVERAKKLAARQGTSLSAMFTRFLETLLKRQAGQEITPGPLARQATGLAKAPRNKSDRELLEDALAEKYGLNR